jgi:hypothetical protein
VGGCDTDALAIRPTSQFLSEPRLADASLTDEHHHGRLPTRRLGPSAYQRLPFGVAPDQSGSGRRLQTLGPLARFSVQYRAQLALSARRKGGRNGQVVVPLPLGCGLGADRRDCGSGRQGRPSGGLQGGTLLVREAERCCQPRDGVAVRGAAGAALQIGDASPREPGPLGELSLGEASGPAVVPQESSKGRG